MELSKNINKQTNQQVKFDLISKRQVALPWQWQPRGPVWPAGPPVVTKVDLTIKVFCILPAKLQGLLMVILRFTIIFYMMHFLWNVLLFSSPSPVMLQEYLPAVSIYCKCTVSFILYCCSPVPQAIPPTSLFICNLYSRLSGVRTAQKQDP